MDVLGSGLEKYIARIWYVKSEWDKKQVHSVVINNLTGTRVIITVVDYNFTGLYIGQPLLQLLSWLVVVIRVQRKKKATDDCLVIKMVMIRTSSVAITF